MSHAELRHWCLLLPQILAWLMVIIAYLNDMGNSVCDVRNAAGGHKGFGVSMCLDTCSFSDRVLPCSCQNHPSLYSRRKTLPQNWRQYWTGQMLRWKLWRRNYWEHQSSPCHLRTLRHNFKPRVGRICERLWYSARLVFTRSALKLCLVSTSNCLSEAHMSPIFCGSVLRGQWSQMLYFVRTHEIVANCPRKGNFLLKISLSGDIFLPQDWSPRISHI